jgi:RimJ/RimL family protein N-acetyltransferase
MIETSRLILRPWRDSDLAAFAEQNVSGDQGS